MEQSYQWIMNCIESSNNEFQFKCCRTLIGLFDTMYKEESDLWHSLTELLTAMDKQEIKHRLEV